MESNFIFSTGIRVLTVFTRIFIFTILPINSCKIRSTRINHLLDLKHSQQKDRLPGFALLRLFATVSLKSAAADAEIVLR